MKYSINQLISFKILFFLEGHNWRKTINFQNYLQIIDYKYVLAEENGEFLWEQGQNRKIFIEKKFNGVKELQLCKMVFFGVILL